MAYSSADFVDDVMKALNITITPELVDDIDAQSNLALAAISNLQNANAEETDTLVKLRDKIIPGAVNAPSSIHATGFDSWRKLKGKWYYTVEVVVEVKDTEALRQAAINHYVEQNEGCATAVEDYLNIDPTDPIATDLIQLHDLGSTTPGISIMDINVYPTIVRISA